MPRHSVYKVSWEQFSCDVLLVGAVHYRLSLNYPWFQWRSIPCVGLVGRVFLSLLDSQECFLVLPGLRHYVCVCYALPWGFYPGGVVESSKHIVLKLILKTSDKGETNR